MEVLKLNKVYIVEVRGGYYEESYTFIAGVFASKDDATAYAERFLSSPELNADYPDVYDACAVEYDVQ